MESETELDQALAWSKLSNRSFRGPADVGNDTASLGPDTSGLGEEKAWLLPQCNKAKPPGWGWDTRHLRTALCVCSGSNKFYNYTSSFHAWIPRMFYLCLWVRVLFLPATGRGMQSGCPWVWSYFRDKGDNLTLVCDRYTTLSALRTIQFTL